MSKSHQPKPAFFDARKLADPTNRYVCWLDLIGAGNAMRLSLPRAANFIAKIHVAGQRAIAKKPGIRAYPAIDGVYAVTEQRATMEAFLKDAMIILSTTFLDETDHHRRFSVRCGVAFGYIYEGAELSLGAPDLAANRGYSQSLAVGPAISNAYESEGQAPFFGICVHDTARTYAPVGETPFPNRLWHWVPSKQYSKEMGTQLKTYFDWAGKNAESILFPADKLPKYRKQVEEYFD